MYFLNSRKKQVSPQNTHQQHKPLPAPFQGAIARSWDSCGDPREAQDRETRGGLCRSGVLEERGAEKPNPSSLSGRRGGELLAGPSPPIPTRPYRVIAQSPSAQARAALGWGLGDPPRGGNWGGTPPAGRWG